MGAIPRARVDPVAILQGAQGMHQVKDYRYFIDDPYWIVTTPDVRLYVPSAMRTKFCPKPGAPPTFDARELGVPHGGCERFKGDMGSVRIQGPVLAFVRAQHPGVVFSVGPTRRMTGGPPSPILWGWSGGRFVAILAGVA